jgi:hypothetical protein
VTISALEPIAQPAATRIGQATAVEQSRAVAEVQAAVVVAQQCPRSIQAAIAGMRQSCSQMGLAERAFFRFPRAGGAVTGPTIHLARELARCWGNFDHGAAELRRDDIEHQSEIRVWAWDIQTNTRSSQIIIVPHKRDKKGGPEVLVDLRDIYENNANNGARRLRQAIFSVLPPWFVEEAKELCNKTLADGGGKPLPQRVADAIRAFERIGITRDQLEQKLDRPNDDWTDGDVAQLVVIFKSLERGEIQKDEEFPPRRTTVADITGGQVIADQVQSAAARSRGGRQRKAEMQDDTGGADPATDALWPEAAQPPAGGAA